MEKDLIFFSVGLDKDPFSFGVSVIEFIIVFLDNQLFLEFDLGSEFNFVHLKDTLIVILCLVFLILFI